LLTRPQCMQVLPTIFLSMHNSLVSSCLNSDLHLEMGQPMATQHTRVAMLHCCSAWLGQHNLVRLVLTCVPLP
jgi:hypothetical protein